MSITAADIQNQVFEHEKRGYNIEQVDEFLSRLENEVNEFNQQLEAANQRNEELLAQLNQANAHLGDYEKRLIENRQDDTVISNAIISAQRSAEMIKREAREAGDKVYREAEAKSRDILRDALAEKQKTLDELARLKDSRERFRTDYLALLQKFVKQAEQTFPEEFASKAPTSGAANAPVPSSIPIVASPDATIPVSKSGSVASYGTAADIGVDELD